MASDWSTRTNRLAGWQSLQHVAAELIDGYADEVAAEEFRQADPSATEAEARSSRNLGCGRR